jgi:GrpB-like predicted nucleotidyltransferase (UPF0157 family)
MDTSRSVSLHRFFWFWRLQFWVEKVWLSLGLGKRVLGIEHVGSTSLPGVPAKPVVDISIAVDDYEQAYWIVAALKSLGYSYLGENSEQREYAFQRPGLFASAVFVCEPDGDKWQARLRFRNYLRTHPQVRRTYAALKHDLAWRHAGDLLAYQRAKLPFVQEILARSEVTAQPSCPNTCGAVLPCFYRASRPAPRVAGGADHWQIMLIHAVQREHPGLPQGRLHRMCAPVGPLDSRLQRAGMTLRGALRDG